MWKYIIMAAVFLLKNSISLTVTGKGRSTVMGANGRNTEFDSVVLRQDGPASKEYISYSLKYMNTGQLPETKSVLEIISNTKLNNEIAKTQNSSILNTFSDSKYKYQTPVFSSIESEENVTLDSVEMSDVEHLRKEEFTVLYPIDDLASIRSEALDYAYINTYLIRKNDELITPTKVLIEVEDSKLASRNILPVASAFPSYILNNNNMITTLSSGVLNDTKIKSFQISKSANYTKSQSMLNDTLHLESSFQEDTIIFQPSLSSKLSITSSINVDHFNTHHKLYTLEKFSTSDEELLSTKMYIDYFPQNMKTETSLMDSYYEVTSQNLIDIVTEFPVHKTVYQNYPEHGVLDISANDKNLLVNHSLKHKQYIFILRKSCNHDNVITQIFKLSNSTLCDEFLAENSTKFVTCESFSEIDSFTNAASEQSVKEVLKLINVDFSAEGLKVIKVHSNTSTYKIILINENNASCTAFHVSKNTAYMTAATSLSLFILSFIGLCIWTKCRRKSTSLDLSNIPHLTLSVDDYKLAPIPRPSISFSENTENISQAYSNETYSRKKPCDTILSQHHFYSNTAKTYIVPSVGKEIPINQELHTFTGKRSNCRNKMPGCQSIHKL